MSLYPSLEDMKLDQLIQAQQDIVRTTSKSITLNRETATNATNDIFSSNVYPMLNEFMGLDLRELIKQNTPSDLALTPTSPHQVVLSSPNNAPGNWLAPLSGQSKGLLKAQVTNGIRQLILCKDKDGKVGVRVQPISNGIFVSLVMKDSPAALAGLRFGDQILEINGTSVAGFTMQEVHEKFKKSPVNGISVVVRDRPLERTITLRKDSAGLLGFQFKNGKITTIIKESSAAKNGVLIDHQLLEIDGQNVVGLKDKAITKIIEESPASVTITVMPNFVYDHIAKSMASSLLKLKMDHSVPNC